MRSRRSRFELACRVSAFGLVGWLLGRSLFPYSGRRVERASAVNIASRLPDWTRAGPTVVLHGDFAVSPDSWVIAWLAALAHSGHSVTWSGSLPAVVMSAEALPDPSGGARIDIAAPTGASVAVRDGAGAIDSVRVSRFGASIDEPAVVGPIVGVSSGQRFGVASPDQIRLREVVVIGAAGWEGKFVAMSLEERGWQVATRFSVAPNIDVGQATALSLDTSRIAAVVAVDSTIRRLGSTILRFVQSGGGLVLAGGSGLASSVATLRPGVMAPRRRPTAQPADSIGLGSTGFYPIVRLNSGGVALARLNGGIAVAARRRGGGRVVQIGYDDTWRWRMAGAAGSANAHRLWWSRIVAAVAYTPDAPARSSRSATTAFGTPNVESAPLAHVVERLGAARAAPSFDGEVAVDPRILEILIMFLLLIEWGSRRMRGFR